MGLKPKSKGHANFYECCDLMKKVYLKYIYIVTFFGGSLFEVVSSIAKKSGSYIHFIGSSHLV